MDSGTIIDTGLNVRMGLFGHIMGMRNWKIRNSRYCIIPTIKNTIIGCRWVGEEGFITWKAITVDDTAYKTIIKI